MKFACDEMLGKLARWLRILGIDTAYKNRIDDRELIHLCREEGRILLTRDTRLISENKEVKSLLIESDHYREQLLQVIGHFHIDPYESAFSRCVLCNLELVEVKKEEVEGEIPPFVFQTQEEFWRCPRCGKLYWPGTHHDHMMRSLEELFGPRG